MSVIDMIKTSLKYDEDMLRKITKLRVNSQEQTLTLKIENGKKYYYIKKRGESKPTYVKPDKMGEVNRIRRARFIEESKAVITLNCKKSLLISMCPRILRRSTPGFPKHTDIMKGKLLRRIKRMSRSPKIHINGRN